MTTRDFLLSVRLGASIPTVENIERFEVLETEGLLEVESSDYSQGSSYKVTKKGFEFMLQEAEKEMDALQKWYNSDL